MIPQDSVNMGALLFALILVPPILEPNLDLSFR